MDEFDEAYEEAVKKSGYFLSKFHKNLSQRTPVALTMGGAANPPYKISFSGFNKN